MNMSAEFHLGSANGKHQQETGGWEENEVVISIHQLLLFGVDAGGSIPVPEATAPSSRFQ